MDHQLQVEAPAQAVAPPSHAPEVSVPAPLAPVPLASVPQSAISRLGILRKLSVGASDDAAEQDADAQADLAVAAIFGAAGHVGRPRRGDSGGEPAGERIARRAEVGWAGGDASADLESTIGRLRGGGRPIAAVVRRQMEDALGADLSSVRVHSGSASRRVNDRLSARAFTLGNDVFFGEREPDVGTAAGAHLYAHELAHVVQQRPQLRRQTLESGGAGGDSAPAPAADGPHQEVVAFLEKGAAEAREPEDVTKLLAAAKLRFGLDDILFDGRDPGGAMVGLVFGTSSHAGSGSTGTGPTIRREVQGTNGWWFVGNVLSDWLIWGGYRAYASAESLVSSNAITQHSQSKVRYGPLTSRGFGTYMMADPLTKQHPKGSQPDATNDTWKILKRRRQKNSATSASYYIRAHLLNDNLGGPGDDWSNLTVLSQRSNNHSPNGHLKAVEADLKTKVSAGTHAYAYEVTANYGRSVTSWGRWIVNALNYVPHWDAAVRELWAAEDHIPVSFSTRVWKYENGAKHLQSFTVEQMQVGKSEDEDGYFVKIDNQPMLNLKDQSSVMIQALVAGGAGALAGLSVMAVRPMFEAYLQSQGQTAEAFGAANQWDYAAMAVALGTAIANWNTAKLNPWPKDRV